MPTTPWSRIQLGSPVGVDPEVDLRVAKPELGEFQPPGKERQDLELAGHHLGRDERLAVHPGGIGEPGILEADGEVGEEPELGVAGEGEGPAGPVGDLVGDALA